MSLADVVIEPLTPAARIRPAIRAAIKILRTGSLPHVEAFIAGATAGKQLGEGISRREHNAHLAALGIAPIRGV